MGNRNCNECKELKVENLAYGEYQVLMEEGKTTVLIEKKIATEKGLIGKLEAQLAKRKSILSPHIGTTLYYPVKLHKYSVEDSQHQISVSLHYQYLPSNLKHLIAETNLKREQFSERQLFNIVSGVEEGLNSLYANGIQHGCINLETILFRNSFFKITDVSSTTCTNLG